MLFTRNKNNRTFRQNYTTRKQLNNNTIGRATLVSFFKKRRNQNSIYAYWISERFYVLQLKTDKSKNKISSDKKSDRPHNHNNQCVWINNRKSNLTPSGTLQSLQ